MTRMSLDEFLGPATVQPTRMKLDDFLSGAALPERSPALLDGFTPTEDQPLPVRDQFLNPPPMPPNPLEWESIAARNQQELIDGPNQVDITPFREMYERETDPQLKAEYLQDYEIAKRRNAARAEVIADQQQEMQAQGLNPEQFWQDKLNDVAESDPMGRLLNSPVGRGFTSGVTALTSVPVEAALRILPNDNPVGQVASQVADQLARTRADEDSYNQRADERQGAPAKYARQVTEMFTKYIPVGAAAGPAALLPFIYSEAQSGAYVEGQKEGLEGVALDAYANSIGVINAGLTYLGGKVAQRFGAGTLEELGMPVPKTTGLVDFFKRYAAGAASETLAEEIPTYLAENTARYIAGISDDAIPENWHNDILDIAVVSTLAQAASSVSNIGDDARKFVENPTAVNAIKAGVPDEMIQSREDAVSLGVAVADQMAEKTTQPATAPETTVDAMPVETTQEPDAVPEVAEAAVQEPAAEPIAPAPERVDSGSLAKSAGLRSDEPPVAPGTVRFYHGGNEQSGARWFSQDRNYAEGYATKDGRTDAGVYYIDLPENHPLLKKAYDDSGTNMVSPYVNFEAPAEIASQAKLLGAEPPVEPPRKRRLGERITAPEEEVVAPPVEQPKRRLGERRPTLKAQEFRQKLTEAATSPEEADALYSLVEARAQVAGESIDDYVGKRFADVVKTDLKESVYLKQRASGRPDALAQTAPETPEFKRWFVESKVVDDKGEPLVVYHGTTKDFDSFSQENKRAPNTEPGFFFATDPEIASRYAGWDENFPSKEIGGVMPVYLNITNPLVVDFKGGKYGRREAIEAARRGGHDGVHFVNHYDAGGVQEQWVAFDPTQIKSATGNQGTFDPNDPSILAQRQGKPIRGEAQRLKEDGRWIIRAFSEAQDLSTLLHELGHVFRRDLSGAMLKAAETWAGVKDGRWNRAAEEKFARGFERYLQEGQAPNKTLADVFAKFKRWLSSVYKTLKGSPIDVQISPEMRAVYDSLFDPPKRRLGERRAALSPEVAQSPAVDSQQINENQLSEESPTEKLGLENPQTINEWIERPMPEGALGIAAKKTIPARKIDDTLKGDAVGSVDPEVEQQWKESKHRPSRDKFLDRAIEAVTNIHKSFTRKWAELDPKKHGATLDILRRTEEIPTWGRAYAANVLRKITAGMGPNKYEVFSRVLILRDLQKDVTRGLYEGKQLPFGYTPETLEADISKFEKIAEQNPDITKAIETRQEFMTTLRNELVDRGLLPESVKEFDDYFHHQVLQYLEGERFSETGIGTRRLAPTKKGFQKQRTGSELNYNTEYLDAEFAVISQAMGQIKLQDSLKHLRKINDVVPMLKEQYGKEWKKHVPEGYEVWQPAKGNVFYPAMTVSDKALQNFLDGTEMLTEEDFHQIWARGQRKEEWVIPSELADTLEDFRPKKDNALEAVAAFGIGRWKKWRLTGLPFFLRYNLNNMSGDLDISLAADPRIAGKYAHKAAKDLKRFHKGEALTPEISRAIELGVIGSGTSSEISRDSPSLTEHQFFSALYGKDENQFKRLWKSPERFTAWREDVLRLAAYRHYQAELNSGKSVYAASPQVDIDQMKAAGESNEVIAARLARDLIGDYGNISAAGTWIRSHLIPFWSWSEINAPRYVRLFKNSLKEGNGANVAKAGAVIAGKKATAQLAKRTIQAGILYGLVNAWNHLVFPDEERELSEDQQNELHVILGKRDDGSVMTMRIEGALADALAWAGLEDAPADIADVASGEATVADKMTDAVKAPINRIVGGSSPIGKAAMEAALGGSTFPDVFDARPIRDPTEHLARLAIPTWLYRKVAGKPDRTSTASEMLLGLLTYTTDPGEAAYYTTRNLAADWQRERGEDPGSFSPGARANALYYHKQAIKYGDEELAEKWLNRYLAMGGSEDGKDDSIERSAPLGFLGDIEKADFLDSLKPEELEVFERASKWYQQTYTPDATGSPVEAIYQKAADKQAAIAVAGVGMPKKKLGEFKDAYQKRVDDWKAGRKDAEQWLVTHKDSPAVQKAVAAARKKVKPRPLLSDKFDPNYNKKVDEWKAKFGESARVVKSLE